MIRPLRPLATLSIVLLVTAGCGGSGTDPAAVAEPAEGPPMAPAFTLPDLDGNTVSLSDSDGNVRIIDFWATWCAPCREEVPMYKELHAEFGDRGVTILALSRDDEGPEVVREFVEEYDIPYVNLLADENLADEFGVVGLPHTFVVDGEGRIVKYFVGPKPKRVLVEWIEKLLAESAPS